MTREIGTQEESKGAMCPVCYESSVALYVLDDGEKRWGCPRCNASGSERTFLFGAAARLGLRRRLWRMWRNSEPGAR